MKELNKEQLLEMLEYAKVGVDEKIIEVRAKINRGKKLLSEVTDIPTQDKYRGVISKLEKEVKDLEAKWEEYDNMIFFSDFE